MLIVSRALAVPISTWQATKLGQYSPYHQFCDYVENVWPNSTNKVPGPHGVGLDQAIYGYAKWFVERFDHCRLLIPCFTLCMYRIV